MNNKVGLVDFDVKNNEHFIKNVLIPYFRDLYKDLCSTSDNKDKGISKIRMRDYTGLPELLHERFFAVMDEDGDGLIQQKEFIHGMFKVYFSKLESKIKMVFDMYDFDHDGLISREDIRLVLSFIPTNAGASSPKSQQEGKYTKEGGGFEDYQDRLDFQKEIESFMDSVMGKKH